MPKSSIPHKITSAKHQQYEAWLSVLAQIPSVAGHEILVKKWITSWCKRRKDILLFETGSGNLLLTQKQEEKNVRRKIKKVTLVAHMDHPGFVIQRQIDERTVEAVFRGGVQASFFQGSKVRLISLAQPAQSPREFSLGTVVKYQPKTEKTPDPICHIRLNKRMNLAGPAIAIWHFSDGKLGFKQNHFHALACDNLAGLTAALAAFDLIRGLKSTADFPQYQVRLLLTRAEELGFIGTLACCKNQEIKPDDGPVIVLENSSAMPDAPLGGGTIVRVGDRTSTFDPSLMANLCQSAQTLEQASEGFKWQRKLMTGGTCEATPFCQWAYQAACVCMPLANYHNMSTATNCIEPEYIDRHDFKSTILLLAHSLCQWSSEASSDASPLKAKLEALYQSRKNILS